MARPKVRNLRKECLILKSNYKTELGFGNNPNLPLIVKSQNLKFSRFMIVHICQTKTLQVDQVTMLWCK